MEMIKDKYSDAARRLITNSRVSGRVTEEQVFQPANSTNREIVDEIVSELLLPGSRFENFSSLRTLHSLCLEGKSCLVLMEHYSNFDIPALHYLVHRSVPDGLAIADSVIPIAGVKLNAESTFVRAFTEAYSRIVIYPSRSLKLFEGTDHWEQEKKLSRSINMAALQQMVRKKHEGNIILLFPSGTRYRPGSEDTRKALPEVDSYLRAFDYILPIGIAGNILRLNEHGTMAEDFVVPDAVIILAGEIIGARDFRERARNASAPGSEPKQAVADAVMETLLDLHRRAKMLRQPLLPEGHPADDDGVVL